MTCQSRNWNLPDARALGEVNHPTEAYIDRQPGNSESEETRLEIRTRSYFPTLFVFFNPDIRILHGVV